MMRIGLTAIAIIGPLIGAGTVAGHPQSTAASDPALRAYVEQTDREWPGESHQQAITVESLVLLSNAIASLAHQRGINARLTDDLAELRANTAVYRAGSPEDPRQSGRLRHTLIQAGDVVQRLVSEADGQRRRDDPALNALRRAADSLDVDQSLRQQPDVLERFFGQAAAILRSVERQPDAKQGV